MATSSQFFYGLVVALFLLLAQLPHVEASDAGKFEQGEWKQAHATFYGDAAGGETTAGSCGYPDTVKLGYGLQTAALSSVMYNNGNACGACFEIKCDRSPEWCKPDHPSIFVTATNWCPPNYALPNDNGGWCNPPREHFDLTMPAFLQIAEYKAGIVPVNYRRIPCQKQGGIRFTIEGHKYFNQVLVWNVAGAGEVQSVHVKGSKDNKWIALECNWGSRWAFGQDLTGQALSFQVMTSDNRMMTSMDFVPENWQHGQTFEGKNFE